MITIKTQGVIKPNGQRLSLNFSLEFDTSDFISLVGESGIGKTTLLRVLCGLDTPERGVVTFQGIDWFNSETGVNLIPQKRDVGMLFQDYALFPNMDVLGNLSFANPFARKEDKLELLKSFGLTDFINHVPSQLSGGQKERVAIARVLIQSPGIILLDEPLNSLDLETQNTISNYLKEFHLKHLPTIIQVTHNWKQAFSLSSKVYEIQKGGVINLLVPSEVAKNISGTILSISTENDAVLLTVLVGNEIINHKVLNGGPSNYKVGQEIDLIFDL